MTDELRGLERLSLTIRIVCLLTNTIIEQFGGHIVHDNDSPDGLVVTAAHGLLHHLKLIISGHYLIICQDCNGRIYSACILTSEPQLRATYIDGYFQDVALLRINGLRKSDGSIAAGPLPRFEQIPVDLSLPNMRAGVGVVALKMGDSGIAASRRLADSTPARYELVRTPEGATIHEVDANLVDVEGLTTLEPLTLPGGSSSIMPSGSSGLGKFVVAYNPLAQRYSAAVVAVASFSGNHFGVWRPIDVLPPAILKRLLRRRSASPIQCDESNILPEAPPAPQRPHCHAAARRVNTSPPRFRLGRMSEKLLWPRGGCEHM